MLAVHHSCSGGSDEACIKYFLAHLKCVKPEGMKKYKSKEIVFSLTSMFFFIDLPMTVGSLESELYVVPLKNKSLWTFHNFKSLQNN